MGYFTIRITEQNNCGTIGLFFAAENAGISKDEGRRRVSRKAAAFLGAT
jgi:hypothetical protein